MARIASVIKQGYYPAPPEAVAGILRHLKIPDPPPDAKLKREDVNILDPVAGEAKALVQIAEGLGVSWGHVFAVELNSSRSARIVEAYPNIRLLGPCSFEGTRITRHSFSLVYLNPPFDDQLDGGGREETSFLTQSVDLLVPNGILILVCPVTQVFGKRRMCGLLDTWFDQLEPNKGVKKSGQIPLLFRGRPCGRKTDSSPNRAAIDACHDSEPKGWPR
jgi:Uncharacterised methyltransferase family (DUF6094)